jgi:hypothetical protein
MYFTFFYEFNHKDIVQHIAYEQNINISYPPSTNTYNDNDADDKISDILENNLKLFFDPSSPPCQYILDVLEANGFKQLHKLHDRWIFHKITK